MKKKIFLFVLLFCIIFVSGKAYALENAENPDTVEAVLLKINGRELSDFYLKSVPMIVNDCTVVPLRSVMEYMGCKVEWNEEEASVKVSGDNFTALFKVGSDEYILNGENKTLPCRVRKFFEDEYAGIVYVPVRVMQDLFSAKIGFEEDTYDGLIPTVGVCTQIADYSVKVGDYFVKLGETTDELKFFCKEPSYKITGENGLIWYVYSQYYTALLAVASDGGIVCGFYTDSPYFETSDGLKYGDKTASGEREYETLQKDGINVSKFNETSEGFLYGVLYLSADYDDSYRYDANYLLKQQCILGVDILNSFRFASGKAAVKYDENAAAACFDHAKYMVENDSLSHTGANSSTGIQRYLYYNPGYKWTSWGENICAGAKNIFICMNSWRNSERHRRILLSDNSFAGIGMYYGSDSRYKYTAAMLILK